MRKSFSFITEDGEEITVDYSIVKEEDAEKPYGIYACIRGDKDESAFAERRYFTYAEALAVVDMLCRYEVTPCTLCDII